MVVPLSVDVGHARLPWGNWLLIVATVVAFFATTSAGVLDPREPTVLMLDGFGVGVLGHVLLHADIVHLLVNMVSLWVFGNACCARVGSLGYLACYAGFAVTTALAHLAMSDLPAVGASGAISGMVGMFFVFHPKDYVRFGVLTFGVIRELPAWVLVGVWLLLNIAGLLLGAGNVAYAGHLGGFAGGVAVAMVLLKSELVEEPPGATLLDLYWRR